MVIAKQFHNGRTMPVVSIVWGLGIRVSLSFTEKDGVLLLDLNYDCSDFMVVQEQLL